MSTGCGLNADCARITATRVLIYICIMHPIWTRACFHPLTRMTERWCAGVARREEAVMWVYVCVLLQANKRACMLANCALRTARNIW